MINRVFRQLHSARAFVVGILGVMLYMAISCSVFASELSGSCGTFMEWTMTGDVLTITGSGDMSDYSDSRFAPWYPYAEEIRTVELPSGTLSIGDFAFYGCDNLTSIEIPEKVTEIGQYAFAQCTKLRQIQWNDNITRIGEGAFQGCEAFNTITFPESLTIPT